MVKSIEVLNQMK